MSAQRLAAKVAWTQLVIAMREDGLIADCVTQSGPATTAVILEFVRADLAANGPWLPMSYKPTPGREVIAVDAGGYVAAPLYYDDISCRWMWNGSEVNDNRFKSWSYVRLPK
jgi:hypothetical protein